MNDLAKMHRVICGHCWTGLDEWVDCVMQLGELSEDDIYSLAAVISRPSTPSVDGPRRNGARATHGRRSR